MSPTDFQRRVDPESVAGTRFTKDEADHVAKLQRFAKDLRVSKQVQETGYVRVSKRTLEHEALVDEGHYRGVLCAKLQDENRTRGGHGRSQSDH